MNIEHLYREARLHELGVILAEFQRDPYGSLQRCGQTSAPQCLNARFRPLLPAQVRAAQRIQQDFAAQDRCLSVMQAQSVSPSHWPAYVAALA